MSEPRFKRSKEITDIDTEFPPPPALSESSESFFEDDEPDAFAKIRAYCESGSGSGMLGIYRALPNKKEQFVCKMDASEFDPEIIKGRFGGGDFIIKAYNERSKIALKQHLSIEGEPIIVSAKPDYEPAPRVQNAPAFDMREFAMMMADNNRQLLTSLASIMQPQSNGRAEMLQEMLTMKELFSSGQQQGGIEMIMKGIELARSVEPRTGEATGMDVLLESIKSLGPAIGAVVKQTNRPPQPRVIKQPQHSDDMVSLPSTNAALPVQKTENEENMIFNYYVGMLVKFAKENRDPILYADLIADNVPDEKICELLNRTDVLEYLESINPGVADVRPWFENVLNELRGIMGLTDSSIPNSVDSLDSIKPDQNANNADKHDSAT